MLSASLHALIWIFALSLRAHICFAFVTSFCATSPCFVPLATVIFACWAKAENEIFKQSMRCACAATSDINCPLRPMRLHVCVCACASVTSRHMGWGSSADNNTRLRLHRSSDQWRISSWPVYELPWWYNSQFSPTVEHGRWHRKPYRYNSETRK